MQKIESSLAAVLGLGVIAYFLWVRLYPVYLKVRESQRGDRGVGSYTQTLFQSGHNDPDHESEIQTMFTGKDSN